MVDIINLILGVVFTTLLLISAVSIKRSHIVILQLGVVISVLIPYILLSSWGSAVITGGVLIRQLTAVAGLKYDKFNSKTVVVAVVALQISAFFALYGISGVEPTALIPLIASLINTVALFMTDIVKLKIGYSIGGVLWLTNEYINGLYSQMVGESINLILMLTAIAWVLSFRKAGYKEENIPSFRVFNIKDAPFLKKIKPVEANSAQSQVA